MTRAYVPIARVLVLLLCAMAVATLAAIDDRAHALPSTAAALAASTLANAGVAPEGEDASRDDAVTSPPVLMAQAVVSHGAESSGDLVPIDYQGRPFFTIQRK